MGILTSLFTAVSGLSAYGNALSITGNNVANVGTVGYKSSRAAFADLVSASLSGGTASDQVGLGVFLNDVQGNFSQGSLTNTGKTLDLAIDGNGFFQVRNASGSNLYSRNGQFEVDSQGRVVDPSGFFLQGFQANAAGVITGTVGDITITSTNAAPQATANGTIVANLDAAAVVPAGAFSVTDPTTYNFSTGMTIHDSLGGPHQLQFYFIKNAAANTWNLFRQIDGGAAVAATNLVFNSSGVLTSGGSQALSLPITGGASTPQAMTMDFTGMTQFGSRSTLLDQTQDGFAAGSFDRFSIDTDGQLVAQFTNGETRTLAQVVLNRFNNPDGLVRQGDNVFTESVESGAAIQGISGSNGLGRIVSGALEQSNVDLGKEFVDMIVNQRAFQANSRAITTSDEMLQELLNLKR
ncbi:MAG: flagellar hook protein FlgE [Nitrospiraceae bacterium]